MDPGTWRITTRTTKHGIQTSNVTEVQRKTSPTFEEMNRLHDSSDVKTTLNEMGYTLCKQSRKKSKLENQTNHRTKRTNSSNDSMDEEMENITTKEKRICKTGITENKPGLLLRSPCHVSGLYDWFSHCYGYEQYRQQSIIP